MGERYIEASGRVYTGCRRNNFGTKNRARYLKIYSCSRLDIINNKNINTHTVTKKKYSENVYLYDFEYKELINIYGENKTYKCIEELSLYKKSKGVEYKSDFATIKRWVIARVEELEQRQEKQKRGAGL